MTRVCVCEPRQVCTAATCFGFLTSVISKILTPRKRSFCAAGGGFFSSSAGFFFSSPAGSAGGWGLRGKPLGTAIEATVGHLHRHEEEIFVNRRIALPTRTYHRGQQGGLRRIRDVGDIDAIEVSLT